MKTALFASSSFLALLSFGLTACVAGDLDDPGLDEPTMDLSPEEVPGYETETICGVTDLVSVNDFELKHGITSRFVQREKIPVGNYRVFENGGTTAWCSGTLIAHDLFLMAGHCLDHPSQLTSNVVQFGFEQNGWMSESLPAASFGIAGLVQDGRASGLDFAIIRLNGNPGLTYGHNTVADYAPSTDSTIAIIQHPAGARKQVDVGHVSSDPDDASIAYDDLDTLGGSSGSGILDANGELVGVHTNGGCTAQGGENRGVWMTDIIDASPTVASTPRHIIVSEQGDPGIHIVNGGARMWISSMEEYNALGLRHEDHRVLPVGAVLSLPTAPRDGTVLRTADGGIYMVFGGARFHVPSMEEFNALGLSWPDVNPAPLGATAALPVVPRHDTLLKERSSDGLYVVRWGYLYWIPSWEVFDAYGYSTRSVRVVPNGTLGQIPYGGTLS